jgi:hypothetical protein
MRLPELNFEVVHENMNFHSAFDLQLFEHKHKATLLASITSMNTSLIGVESAIRVSYTSLYFNRCSSGYITVS